MHMCLPGDSVKVAEVSEAGRGQTRLRGCRVTRRQQADVPAERGRPSVTLGQLLMGSEGNRAHGAPGNREALTGHVRTACKDGPKGPWTPGPVTLSGQCTLSGTPAHRASQQACCSHHFSPE